MEAGERFPAFALVGFCLCLLAPLGASAQRPSADAYLGVAWPTAMALSPSGNLLAITSMTGIGLYHAGTYVGLGALEGHTTEVNDLAFSHDGSKMFSISSNELVAWDVPGRTMIDSVRFRSPKGLLAVSPDNSTVVIGTPSGVEFYDARSLGQVGSLVTTRVVDVEYSPDGSLLAVGGGATDGYVEIFSMPDKQLLTSLAHDYSPVGSVAFSPNGELLGVGGWSGQARLWNIERLLDGESPQELGGVYVSEFAEVDFLDSDMLVASGYGVIKTLRASTRQEEEIEGLFGQTQSAVVNRKYRTLASGTHEHRVEVRDLATGALLHTLSGNKRVSSLAFSPDGRVLATGGETTGGAWDLTVRLWDTDRCIETATLGSHSGKVEGLAFSTSGRYLVSSGGLQIYVWDTISGLPVDTLAFGSSYGDSVGPVAFHPARDIVAGGVRTTVGIFDLTTGVSYYLPSPTGQYPRAVAFSPDGDILAVAEDNSVVIWDYAESSVLETLVGDCGSGLYRLAFTPSGRHILAGGSVGLCMWDLQSRKALSTSIGSVTGLGVHPNGAHVIAAANHQMLVLRAADLSIETYWATPEYDRLAINPDGTVLASGAEVLSLRSLSGAIAKLALDTRSASAAPASAVSPPFELSTLVISGRVLSTSGAPLVASVQVADVMVRSAPDGQFLLAGLAPGRRYSLTITAAGHGVGRLGDLLLSEGRSLRDLVVRLEPAAGGPRRVEPLWPLSEEPSTAMQGGAVVRYFRVVDASGTGQPGAVVRTDTGLQSSPSGTDGVVAVSIQMGEAPGSRRQVRVTAVDGVALTTPIAFETTVAPRSYEMLWESDGYSRMGISFVNVERGRGSRLRLVEQDGDLQGFEHLEIGREVRSGAGVVASLGAVAGVHMSQVRGVQVGVGAEARASAEGMLSAVSEDRYEFPYGTRTTTQAMAQYALIADGMVGSLSPQLVNLLAFVETRLAGASALQDAYTYGGRGLDAMGGVRARASAGAAASVGSSAVVGVVVGADARGEGHGTLTWAEYPRESEASVALGLTAVARVKTRAQAGMIVATTGQNELGAAAFAGARAGGLAGGEVEFVYAQRELRRINVSTRWRGTWGSQVGAAFLLGHDTSGGDHLDGGTLLDLRGHGVEVETMISVHGRAQDLITLLADHPLVRVARGDVSQVEAGGGTIEGLLASISEGVRLTPGRVVVTYEKSVRSIVTESGGEIDLEAQLGVSALRVAFRGANEVERHKKVVLERGAWINGRLRPLEVYQDDGHTPGTERTMANLVQEIHDGMGDVVQQAFTAVVAQVREGAETVVVVGRFAFRVGVQAGQNLSQVGAVVWSWWGPDPAARPAALLPADYAVRAKIAATAQAAARLEYGIGGFYQLTPAGEVLSAPADLTIGYADDEVASLDEQSLAVYTFDKVTGQWLPVGGTVDATANTVTVPVSVLGVYTLAPRIPNGDFDLHLQGEFLPADGTSRIQVVSDTVWNNDGTPVADGTSFDVWITGGSVGTQDADRLREGHQVRAEGAQVRFEVQAGLIAGPAEVVARSVAGNAVGRSSTLTYTDAAPPTPPPTLRAEMRSDMVVLRWGASPQPDLAGYRLYYRESGSGPPYDGVAAPPGLPSPVAVGVDTSATLAGLRSERHYAFVVTAYDVEGNESGYSEEVSLVTTITAVVEPGGETPGDYSLAPAYPNPFNANTVLRFTTPEAGRIRLAIFNITGQLVRELLNTDTAAGTHLATWDGLDDVSRQTGSGVYLAVLEATGYRQTRRIALLR